MVKTMLQRIQDTYRYLDDNGLAKLISLLKFGNKKIWHGSYSDWDSLPQSEKGKYDISEVIGTDSQGILHNVNTLELNNTGAVTGNIVKRKLGSAFVDFAGTEGPGGAKITPSSEMGVHCFDGRYTVLNRSGNRGFLNLQPRDAYYGVTVNIAGRGNVPIEGYGALTFRLPEGMKFAPAQSFAGVFGDVYRAMHSSGEQGSTPLSRMTVGGIVYAGAGHGGWTPADERTAAIYLWIYPNDGQSHSETETTFVPHSWITIPVLFDDDWHA